MGRRWGGPFDLNRDGRQDAGEWYMGYRMTTGGFPGQERWSRKGADKSNDKNADKGARPHGSLPHRPTRGGDGGGSKRHRLW